MTRRGGERGTNSKALSTKRGRGRRWRATPREYAGSAPKCWAQRLRAWIAVTIYTTKSVYGHGPASRAHVLYASTASNGLMLMLAMEPMNRRRRQRERGGKSAIWMYWTIIAIIMRMSALKRSRSRDHDSNYWFVCCRGFCLIIVCVLCLSTTSVINITDHQSSITNHYRYFSWSRLLLIR